MSASLYDTVIIGTGPAGVSAALYTARAGFRTALFGMSGGALEKASRIENYYGLQKPLSGAELYAAGVAQARAVGADVFGEEITQILFGDVFILTTTQRELEARTVILASGKQRKAPPVPGVDRLEGHGVSYCAVCDGFFYRGRPVGVIGAGAYAAAEAAHLARIADSVTIFTNGEEPQAEFPDRAEIVTEPLERIEGAEKVETVVLRSGARVLVDGVFIAVGTASAADFARKLGVIVENDNIQTDASQATNVPGVFAAGDCTGGLLQIASAVGEGAVAGTSAVRFLRAKK